jgi:hypothetical protein
MQPQKATGLAPASVVDLLCNPAVCARAQVTGPCLQKVPVVSHHPNVSCSERNGFISCAPGALKWLPGKMTFQGFLILAHMQNVKSPRHENFSDPCDGNLQVTTFETVALRYLLKHSSRRGWV